MWYARIWPCEQVDNHYVLEQCPQGNWGAVGGLLGPLPPTSEDAITNIRDFTNQYKQFHRVIHTSQGTGSPIHRGSTLTKFCTE